MRVPGGSTSRYFVARTELRGVMDHKDTAKTGKEGMAHLLIYHSSRSEFSWPRRLVC